MKKMYNPLTIFIVTSAFILSACGSNGGGGGRTPKEGTALYRSYQLADNVEKIPTTKDIYGNNNGGVRNIAVKKNAVRDETDPSEDVIRFPAYDCYYDQLWSAIDGGIESAKETKNYVVTHIYSFNTWIRGTGNINYRLNYDANRDAAIIETMIEQSDTEYSYTNIYTTYDEKGRMLIDSVGYFIRYQNNEIKIINKSSVSYVEGLYWDYTQLETQEDFGEAGIVYHYVIHADLTKEEKEITQIQLSEVLRRDGSIEDVDARPSIQMTTEHLNYVTNNDINGNMLANIYDKKGYNYIQGHTSGYTPEGCWTDVTIPLYRLTGYDKIENHYEGDDWGNGTRYVTIGNKRYGGQDYEYNGLRWRVNEMVFGPGVEPAITINLNYLDYSEREAAQLIRDFLSSIGLSYKEDYLDEAFHLELNKVAICEEREAFGKKNYLYITIEEFNILYEHYDLGNYTVKDLREYLNAEKIDINQQVEDDGYYSVVSSSATGSYTFDQENEKLSIGEVTLNVEKNALLNKDTDYVGVVALKSGRDIIVIKESDPVHFDGVNDINVTIPASNFDIKELPANNDDSFEVVAYLAIKDGENLSRCSSASPISYVGEEVEYLISVYDSREHEQEEDPMYMGEYIEREYFSIINSTGKYFNKHYFTTEYVADVPNEPDE